jgi:hypothetical protein
MMRKFIVDSVMYWAKEYHIDGFRFDLMGLQSTDLKQRANDIARKYFPSASGLLSGSAGMGGPFRIQAEYLRRSSGRAIVVMALIPQSRLNSNSDDIVRLDDVGNGTALAQFGDANAVQCETFAPANGVVDFLFVVDDSCSMAASQTALAQAGTAMANKLNNSSLDWRIGMVTTTYHIAGGAGGNVSIHRGYHVLLRILI